MLSYFFAGAFLCTVSGCGSTKKDDLRLTNPLHTRLIVKTIVYETIFCNVVCAVVRNGSVSGPQDPWQEQGSGTGE
jgi:hypothetical protein